MAKWKRDLIFGIGVLVTAGVASYAVRGMNVKGLITAARPDIYLWVWMSIMALLAIGLIIRAVVKKDQTKLDPIWRQEGVITCIAMFIYLLVMPLIGFTISSIVFELALFFYYGWRMGKFNPKTKDKKDTIKFIVKTIVIALVSVLATKYIFTEFLSVRLPKGKIF